MEDSVRMLKKVSKHVLFSFFFFEFRAMDFVYFHCTILQYIILIYEKSEIEKAYFMKVVKLSKNVIHGSCPGDCRCLVHAREFRLRRALDEHSESAKKILVQAGLELYRNFSIHAGLFSKKCQRIYVQNSKLHLYN